ncbi:3-oxoacyl-[acyl-carrier protein] reductase [uncultured Rubrobacteraceae bacterium]|uniref:3-oxoacyl-[acyl-carrier protein] reductase n=1 Tax=uncultured Rubrobacteraceae bacterium TaxID=349277 RepID=A0A6J4QK99_9ACTN|nr:3-oxoacyl-[acyl-carrier protein] reductase [uncultured Rubrobacteraceae bacterium]
MNNPNGGMGGKTVLVTGGTSGIGKATAVALAAMGADVVVIGRNPERGEAAVEEIKAQSHSEAVELMLADLSVRAEVRRLAEEFQERHDRLDVLANNAGLVQSKRTETEDGIEMTLAINHLAPFLLTSLLLGRLEQSAPSRVITVSSEAQRWGNMDFDDMQSTRKYRGFPVYGMTKLANIMFTYELAERLKGTGVTANCLHPGGVSTNFGKNNGGPMALFFRAAKPFMRSPEQGADTLVWLASSPDVEGVSGKYFSDRKEIEAKKIAYDPAARRRLWEISEDLTGLKVAA